MTTKIGIIYLQKERFQLYSPYLSNVLEFRFVQEISLDFDIFNKELFDNLLRTFIINNKVPAGNFIIVIADNASFIKDFTNIPAKVQNAQQAGSVQSPPAIATLEDLQTEASEFIEHVPFEEVASKIYPLPNGIRAYATNKEMFENIKSVLERQGFIIDMVIPGYVFGQEISALQALNINSINLIFQKMSLVKEYNLLANTGSDELITSDEPEEKETEESSAHGVKGNKRFVLIIGVAVIALIFIITGVILYLQFTARPNNSSAAVVKPVMSPKITQSAGSASSIGVKDLTVQVVNASSSAATVETVRTTLDKYGFKSVSTQTQENSGASTSLLIFSEKVSTETKNAVTVDVRKIIGNILVQEKNNSVFDIIIVVGK